MSEDEVRLDWNTALNNCDNEPLSPIIGWGFTQQDLLVLCCLHEADKHREVIENLLEDCNFHTECGLLSECKYDECRRLIFEVFN